MPNARFSQFLDRWMNRVRGSKKPTSHTPRKWPKLGMELFEERVVPAVVPDPIASVRSTLGAGYDPSIAIDPTNHNRLVMASTDGVNVSLRMSLDGGSTWRQIFLSSPNPAPSSTVPINRLFDPTVNARTATSLARAYTNASNPTVVFSRPDVLGKQYVYLTYLQTNNTAAKTQGVLVMNKFDLTGTAALEVNLDTTNRYPFFDGKVLYQWANQDPILNPVVAIDTNVPNYTDPGQDDTAGTGDAGEVTYTDSMSNKAVYVAWNTNATNPAIPLNLGETFLPNRIFVMASGDEGINFTNPMEVDDEGYFAPLPSPQSVLYGMTTPQITFSPGNSQIPGHLVFSWSSTQTGRMSIENSSPDGGNPLAPVAGSQTFLSDPSGVGTTFLDALPGTNPSPTIQSFFSLIDPFLGAGISFQVTFNVPVFANTFTAIDVRNILDVTTSSNLTGGFTVIGIDPAGNAVIGANQTDTFIIRNPNIIGNHTFNPNLDLGNITGSGNGVPDIPRTTYFPQVILPGNITDAATNVTDLNVSLALSNTNLESLEVRLLYFGGNTTVSNFSNTTPTLSVLLVNNRILADGNASTVPGDPTYGLPLGGSGLNKNFLGVYDYNLNGTPPAANPLNRVVIGTTFDEQAPRLINDGANIQPWIGSYRPEILGNTADFLSDFNGFTATDLVGTWVIQITDYRYDGNQPAAPGPFRPAQTLEFWSLNVTSHIDNQGFGADTTVGTSLTAPYATLTSGIDSVQPTKPAVAPIVGVGSGQSIAIDSSVGSFSPYAGRLYMAYTTGTAAETNINLIYSDDNGSSWTRPVRATGFPAGQVSLDSLSDNYSEGNRFQFQPNVTVDPLTGAVVLTWYDARLDAQNRRVATFMAVSIDGGDTFSKEIPINQSRQVRDTITNSVIDVEPIPSNLTTVAASGFGNNQAVVAFGGRVNVLWSGNDNGNSLSVKSAVVRYASGPRVVYADGGPVVANTTTPTGFGVYNNTFAADGTRQVDGFSIQFDRPVDVDSFKTGDIQVYFLRPDDNPINGGVLAAGTLVNVGAVTPLDLGGVVAGSALTFFVSFASPQSDVGTYSFVVGGVRDAIRNVDPATSTTIAAGSQDTPFNFNFNNTPITSIISHPGLPAGQLVDEAVVTLNFSHSNPTQLYISLISPTGAEVVLFDSVTNGWGNPDSLYDTVQFSDFAPGGVGTLTALLDVPALGCTTYIGNVTPDALLAAQPGLSTAFDGENARGNWTLFVNDFSDPLTDSGTLISWSLTLKGSGGIPFPQLALGNPEDQDADSIYGEPDNDAFSNPTSTAGSPLVLAYDNNTLPLIIPGPHVVGTSNATIVGTNATSVVVTFDRDINPATFTAGDVLRLNTPAGAITTGFTVTPIDARNYRVTFPSQIAGGSYSLEIGPNIQSAAGDLMDNNLNAGLDRLRGGNPLTSPLRFNDYTTSSAPVTIAANTTVSMPLAITDSFNINQNNFNQIQVRLNISYSQPSDLVAELVSPLGTRIRLFTSPGPLSSTIGNFSNTLLTDFGTTPIQNAIPQFDDGPYTPQFPLSPLIGEGSSGTWFLEIKNNGSASGTIDDFSLRLPFAESGTGLGEDPGDRTTVGFRIHNLNPTDEVSRDVWTPVGASQVDIGTLVITSRVGRVTAIAADPSDPTGNTVYVGAASGGVWKTSNFLTNDPIGPTWVALTDFGAVGSLAIGSITVVPRNNDPLQSIVMATTGNAAGSSPNFSVGNAPGVGMIRSADGGRTWRVFDSSVNVDAAGNVLPLSSPLRDHVFVGSTAFKLVADPHVDSFGKNILYMAVSGNANQRGIWRSNNGGETWTRILIGNASDVVLAAGSQNVDGTLQLLYASVANVGVFLASNAPTAAPATGVNPNGSFFALNGGSGNPLIRNVSVVNQPPVAVNNPPTTPSGAPGFIKLGVPALSDSPLKNDFYQGWIYAMTNRGLYMSKDFGANWTFIQLPTLGVGAPIPVFYATNNESRADVDVDGTWSNFGYDLFVDPVNPNIVYAGGETLVKFDTTVIKDPQNFSTADYSDSTGNITGGVQSGINVLVYDPVTRSYVASPSKYINLKRDPNNPFVSPSSIPVTANTAVGAPPPTFLNNGSDVKWQYVTTFLEDDLRPATDAIPIEGRGVQDLFAMVDPITKRTRLMFGSEGGVYSLLDAESGKFASGFGNAQSVIGSYSLPGLNRNGSLQISQFISGAVQPSQFAADLAGAMFYAASPIADLGSPVSSSDAVTSGSVTYFNNTDAGTWVAVDPSGSGDAFQFQAGTNYLGPVPTDFFHYIGNTTDPTRGGVSRTNGLFTPGGATGGTAQWQQLSAFPGFLSAIPNFGQAAVNERDPNGLLVGSGASRIYRSTDKGKNWFQVAAPSDIGSSPAMALSFGAPNSNAAAGPIVGTNNFLYAGNQVGRIYITLTGGAPWKASAPLTLAAGGTDTSPVMKIIASPISGRFDAYAVTQRGVYYLADARVATPTWQNISGNLFSLQETVYGVTGDLAPAVTELTSLAVDWRGIGGTPNDSNTAQPAILYVGGDGAVFRTKNAGAAGGTTWTIFPSVIADGSPKDGGYLPRNRIVDLDLSLGDIDPNTGVPKKNSSGLNMLLATTYGRGQFAIRLDNALNANAFVSGPRVDTATNTSVAGTPSLRVVFTGPVLSTSFDTTDVSLVLNGGSTTIPAVSVTPVAHIVGGVDLRDTFDIVFAVPVSTGNYTLTIGKDVTDLAGNPMNQNNNTVNGEASDSYKQQLIVATTTPYFTVLARIAGTAFLDFNADGLRQAAETGVSGRTLFLDFDNNGVINGNEPTRVSDALGRYDFGNFTANTYRVREVLYGPHVITGNAAAIGGVNVTLASGSDQTAVDIGHRLVSSIFPTRITTNLFSQTFANSNTAYVYNVFRSLLGIDPSASDLAYHVNALNSGYNRTDYATSIYNRPESLNYQVDKIYQTVLKHPADAAGIAFWADQFRRGLQPEWLVVQLMTANEYQTSHASNASFITGVYTDILGRTPTAGDISFWTNFLSNHSRFDMAFAFAYSAESYTRAVQDVFVQYLHREATPADVNFWVPKLVNRNLTVSRLAILLISSAEFGTKALNATG